MVGGKGKVGERGLERRKEKGEIRVVECALSCLSVCLSCRVEWMYLYQGMVILATNQVWWTWEVEDVFRKVKKGDKMAMKNYSKKLHTQIDDLVVQVRERVEDNMQIVLCIECAVCIIIFIMMWDSRFVLS